MLKRRTVWIALVVSLLVIGFGIAAMKKRQAAAPGATAHAAQTTPAKATSSLEFLPSDVARVQSGDLRQILQSS